MAGMSLAGATSSAPAQARTGAAGRPEGTPRVRELDGIRAIAILAVLVAHALGVGPAIPALRALHGWNSVDWVIVGHLWLAVDLFFVLSGFLITGILLDARGERNYYQNFYIRRALRILPVLCVFLALVAAVYHGPAAYFALALLFCANFAGYLNVGTPPGAGPLWSLGVEEQFYLLWPTVVRRFVPGVALWIAAAICVVVPCLRALSHDPSHDVSLTWMRCDGLALGALLATWVHLTKPTRRQATVPIVGALVLAAAIWLAETLLHAEHLSRALRPTEADLVFAATVLAAYAWRGSRATALLRCNAAAFIAGTSYCAYVIHLSVYNVVDALGLTASPSPLTAGLFRLLWSVPVIFAFAAISKRFLEDPFLRLKSTFAPRVRALDAA